MPLVLLALLLSRVDLKLDVLDPAVVTTAVHAVGHHVRRANEAAPAVDAARDPVLERCTEADGGGVGQEQRREAQDDEPHVVKAAQHRDRDPRLLLAQQVDGRCSVVGRRQGVGARLVVIGVESVGADDQQQFSVDPEQRHPYFLMGG